MTQAGIEPATFRFVAQHLNNCAAALMNKIKVLSTRRHCYVKRQETVNDVVANYLSSVRYKTPSSEKKNIQSK